MLTWRKMIVKFSQTNFQFNLLTGKWALKYSSKKLKVSGANIKQYNSDEYFKQIEKKQSKKKVKNLVNPQVEEFLKQQEEFSKGKINDSNIYLQGLNILPQIKSKLNEQQLLQFINYFSNTIINSFEQFDYFQHVKLLLFINHLQISMNVNSKNILVKEILKKLTRNPNIDEKIQLLLLLEDLEASKDLNELCQQIYLKEPTLTSNQLVNFFKIITKNQVEQYIQLLYKPIFNRIENVYQFECILKHFLLTNHTFLFDPQFSVYFQQSSPTTQIFYHLQNGNYEDGQKVFNENAHNIDSRISFIFQIIFQCEIDQDSINKLEFFHTLDQQWQIKILEYFFAKINQYKINPFTIYQQQITIQSSEEQKKRIEKNNLLLNAIMIIARQVSNQIKSNQFSLKSFIHVVFLFKKNYIEIDDFNQLISSRLNDIPNNECNPYKISVIRSQLDYNFKENRLLLLKLDRLSPIYVQDLLKQILRSQDSLIQKIYPFEACNWLNINGDDELQFEINNLIEKLLKIADNQRFIKMSFDFIARSTRVKAELITKLSEKVQQSGEKWEFKNRKFYNQERFKLMKELLK